MGVALCFGAGFMHENWYIWYDLLVELDDPMTLKRTYAGRARNQQVMTPPCNTEFAISYCSWKKSG